MTPLYCTRLALTRGMTRPMGLLALTLLVGITCLLAGCSALPGLGGSVSISLVGLWLVIASTVGLLVGCGGPSLNASQGGAFPPTVTVAPAPTVPTAVALKFVQQPTKGSANAQVLDVITPSPQVEAVDQNGNRVTTFTGSVTVTLNAPPGITLLGTATRNAVAGVATFNDLRLSLAGVSYTLQASSGSLQASTSLEFTTTPLSLSFAPPQAYSANGGCGDVETGDFNLDGKPDLVVANYSTGTLSVLIGNGDGTFQAQSVLALSSALTVNVADVNLDSKPDLVATNFFDKTVSVLLGNGDGTFQVQQTFLVGSNPRFGTVSDLNQDKNPDLVVACSSSNSVSVLLGNGDGTFQNQRTFDVAGGPIGVALGDMNGDNKTDIFATSNLNPSVSLLLGNGDGTFQNESTFASGATSFAVVVGDVNLDGKLDVAITNTTPNTVSVLLGNGNGSFQARQTFVSGTPQVLRTGDFNLDGKPDLATANATANNVTVLLGNGDGTFLGATGIAAGQAPLGVVSGDFNLDGKPDFATANYNSADITVMLHD